MAMALPAVMTAQAAPVHLAQAKTAPPQKPPSSKEQDDRQHATVLRSLLDRLATIEDEQSAQVLEQAIWKLWLRSGSATIDVLTSRAVSLINEGAFDKALDLLDVITRLAPDYSEGWNKRATVLYFLRRYEHSREDIKRALKLEPRHFGALSGLGLVLRELDDKKGALDAFRQALKIHPFLQGALDAVKILGPEVEGHEL